jgi:hypothetical protein
MKVFLFPRKVDFKEPFCAIYVSQRPLLKKIGLMAQKGEKY